MIKLTRQNHTKPDCHRLEEMLEKLKTTLDEVPYDDIGKNHEVISEIVNFQDSDGSFKLVDSWIIESDCCVAYCYVPTYLCSAILMKFFLADKDWLTGKEKHIFPSALIKCCERGLKGQGFDDVHGQIEGMRIFIKGGVFEFILKYPTLCPEFTRMILGIVNFYRSCILRKKCVFGYGSYETEFKEIVDAYDSSIKADSPKHLTTITQGHNECLACRHSELEQREHLIGALFPGNTFQVVRAIRESEHSVTITGICSLTGLDFDKVTEAVAWLYDHGVIVQDTRSIDAGHDISNPNAFFYTKDDQKVRGLVSYLIEWIDQAEEDEEKATLTRYYLAYGSNLNLGQMRYRCPTAEKVGTASIEGYRLMFKGIVNYSYLTIEKASGFSVPVGVFRIGKDDEASLDRYEGFPHKYYKKDFHLTMTDDAGLRRSINAFAYIMREDHKLALPSKRYIETVTKGYREFGFDESLIGEAIDFSVK